MRFLQKFSAPYAAGQQKLAVRRNDGWLMVWSMAPGADENL